MASVTSLLKESQFWLLLSYSVLTFMVAFQIARIVYYRHALVSFQLGFLILCLIWGILRIVFWSLVKVIGDTIVGEAMVGIPLNFQFATFSLLVLYYAHLVHKSSWDKSTKKEFTITYILVNLILLIMQGVWVGYLASVTSEYAADMALRIQAAIAALVFLILVGILAWYGYRLHHVIQSATKQQMLFHVPPLIFLATFIIVLLFSSRCVFDFGNVAGIWGVELDNTSWAEQLFIFFAYLAWEIVPTALIVFLFWRIPTTHIGGLTRRGRATMFMLPPSAIKTLPSVSRLFNDPQRYDSDDETTGFLHRGSPVTYTAPPQPSSYTYTFGKNAPYATTPSSLENPRHLPDTPGLNTENVGQAVLNTSTS